MVTVLAFVLNLLLLIILLAVVRNRLTLLIQQAVDDRFSSLQNKLQELDAKLERQNENQLICLNEMDNKLESIRSRSR